MYHLFSAGSQSVCNSLKAEQGRIIFLWEKWGSLFSYICWARGVKIASSKISIRQLFTLNLQYLGKLPPSTGIQEHTISFPSVNQGGWSLRRALPFHPGMPLKGRFPRGQRKPQPKAEILDIFLPLSSYCSFSCQWFQHCKLCKDAHR